MNRTIEVCVTKDIETAMEYNVTLQTVEGSATSEGGREWQGKEVRGGGGDGNE
jgi:hypothetical protein